MLRILRHFCSIPTNFKQGKAFIKKPITPRTKPPQIHRQQRIYEFLQMYKIKRNSHEPNDYGKIAEEALFHTRYQSKLEQQHQKDFDQIIRDMIKIDPKQLHFDNSVKMFSLYQAMEHYDNRPPEAFKLLHKYLLQMFNYQLTQVNEATSLTHLVQLYTCSCIIGTKSNQFLEIILRVIKRKIQPEKERKKEQVKKKYREKSNAKKMQNSNAKKIQNSNVQIVKQLEQAKIVSKEKYAQENREQPQDYFTEILNQQDDLEQQISDFKCQNILADIGPIFAAFCSKPNLNMFQARIVDFCMNWMQSVNNMDLFSDQVLISILLGSNKLQLIHKSPYIQRLTNQFLLKSSQFQHSLMFRFLKQTCYMNNNFIKIYSTLYNNLISIMGDVDRPILPIGKQEVNLKIIILLLGKVSPYQVLPEHANIVEASVSRYISKTSKNDLYARLIKKGIFDRKIEQQTCLVSKGKIELTWNILFQCLARNKCYNLKIIETFLAEKGQTMPRPIHMRSYVISRLHHLHPNLVTNFYQMELRQWSNTSDETTKAIAKNWSNLRIMKKWHQQFGHLFVPRLNRLMKNIKEPREQIFIQVYLLKSIDYQKDYHFFQNFNQMHIIRLGNLLEMELLKIKCDRSKISPVYLQVIFTKLKEKKVDKSNILSVIVLYLNYTLKECNPQLPEKTLHLYFKTLTEVVLTSMLIQKDVKNDIVNLIKMCFSLQEWLYRTSFFKQFLLRLQSQLKFITKRYELLPNAIELFAKTALNTAVTFPLDQIQGKSLNLLSCGNDVKSAETIVINLQNISVCFYKAQRATELASKLNQLQTIYQSLPGQAFPPLFASFNYPKDPASCSLFNQLSSFLSVCPIDQIDLISIIPKITLFRSRDSEHGKIFFERVIAHCKIKLNYITLAEHLEVLIACRFFSCQDQSYFTGLINRIIDGSCCDDQEVFQICEALLYLDYSFSQKQLKSILDRYSYTTSQQAIMVIILQDYIITPTLSLTYLTKILQSRKDKLHISKTFLRYINYIYPGIVHKLDTTNSFDVSLLKEKRISKVLNAITSKTERSLQIREQPFSYIQDSKDNVLIFPANSSRCLLRFLNKSLRLQTSKMQQTTAFIAGCDPISPKMKILQQIYLNNPELMGDHYENIKQELIQQGEFTT